MYIGIVTTSMCMINALQACRGEDSCFEQSASACWTGCVGIDVLHNKRTVLCFLPTLDTSAAKAAWPSLTHLDSF